MENIFKTYMINRQKILDILKEYKDDENIAYISQTKIAKIMNLSTTRINQIFKELINDNMIEKIDKGIYKIIKENISESKELNNIMKTIIHISNNTNDFKLNENTLGKKLNVDRKIIQKAKTFILNNQQSV